MYQLVCLVLGEPPRGSTSNIRGLNANWKRTQYTAPLHVPDYVLRRCANVELIMTCINIIPMIAPILWGMLLIIAIYDHYHIYMASIIWPYNAHIWPLYIVIMIIYLLCDILLCHYSVNKRDAPTTCRTLTTENHSLVFAQP